ncbi:MAG TPA: methyltransferase domain-containing protein [Candidatus Limnocylindrales bacterium]
MDACGCDTFASIFDRRTAERDRQRYRQKGPDRSTRMLLDLIRNHGVSGATVLDVGGGIGVIDQELLRVGATHAVLCDASPAYLAVARDEARRNDLLDRMDLVEGDFVRRSGEIEAADVVTLDRVICCYGDVDSLVTRSARLATRLYGVVVPRDRWIVRAGLWLERLLFAVRRSPYRPYAHRNALIDRRVADQGLLPVAETGTFGWRVVLYQRVSAGGQA